MHKNDNKNNEDDDSIVNDEEIDTNINESLGENVINSISRTYKPQALKKWRIVSPIRENYGQPGEMGTYN